MCAQVLSWSSPSVLCYRLWRNGRRWWRMSSRVSCWSKGKTELRAVVLVFSYSPQLYITEDAKLLVYHLITCFAQKLTIPWSLNDVICIASWQGALITLHGFNMWALVHRLLSWVGLLAASHFGSLYRVFGNASPHRGGIQVRFSSVVTQHPAQQQSIHFFLCPQINVPFTPQ